LGTSGYGYYHYRTPLDTAFAAKVDDTTIHKFRGLVLATRSDGPQYFYLSDAGKIVKLFSLSL